VGTLSKPAPGVLLLALWCAIGHTGQAVAGPVHGQNPVIDLGDRIYIPLDDASSRGLGELVGIGAYQSVVGLDPDRVTLTRTNPHAVGTLRMITTFDISDEFSEQFPVLDRSSDIPLVLTLRDLDFKPCKSSRNVTFSESLEIRLVDSDEVPIIGASPLLLDETSYLNFRGDVDRFGRQIERTNNLRATYELSLMSLFGSNHQEREAFIDLLNEEHTFGLMFTLSAHLKFTGRGRITLRNSPESIEDAVINVSVAPEPSAVLLLLLGFAAIPLRRARR